MNIGFKPRSRAKLDGGAEGIRTHDPHNAIVVLYQLSYDPSQSAANLPAWQRQSQSHFPEFSTRRFDTMQFRANLASEHHERTLWQPNSN